jgi:hypothetical protein
LQKTRLVIGEPILREIRWFDEQFEDFEADRLKNSASKLQRSTSAAGRQCRKVQKAEPARPGYNNSS